MYVYFYCSFFPNRTHRLRVVTVAAVVVVDVVVVVVVVVVEVSSATSECGLVIVVCCWCCWCCCRRRCKNAGCGMRDLVACVSHEIEIECRPTCTPVVYAIEVVLI